MTTAWEQIKAAHKGWHGPEIRRRTDDELAMDRITQVPAGQVEPPADTHQSRIEAAGRRIDAEHAAQCHSGRTVRHGGAMRAPGITEPD